MCAMRALRLISAFLRCREIPLLRAVLPPATLDGPDSGHRCPRSGGPFRFRGPPDAMTMCPRPAGGRLVRTGGRVRCAIRPVRG